MIQIKAVQFLRPDGRQCEVNTQIPDDLGEQWDAICKAGLRLTVEELITGEASLCLENPQLGDFDGEIVQNGPEVPQARDRLIRRFREVDYRSWCASVDRSVDHARGR